MSIWKRNLVEHREHFEKIYSVYTDTVGREVMRGEWWKGREMEGERLSAHHYPSSMVLSVRVIMPYMNCGSLYPINPEKHLPFSWVSASLKFLQLERWILTFLFLLSRTAYQQKKCQNTSKARAEEGLGQFHCSTK